MKTLLKNTGSVVDKLKFGLAAATVLGATSVARAQEAGVPDFDPIIQAANWQSYVVPAMMGIAGAIAGVLVIKSGIGWVLGSIRSAGGR